MDGVDGIIHQRVVANKGDHIIWEILGGSHVGCKCPAWALKKEKINKRKYTLRKSSLCLNNNHFQNSESQLALSTLEFQREEKE